MTRHCGGSILAEDIGAVNPIQLGTNVFIYLMILEIELDNRSSPHPSTAMNPQNIQTAFMQASLAQILMSVQLASGLDRSQ